MERAQKTPISFGLLFLLFLIILIFGYIRWQDVVIPHPDGTYSIDDATADKIADRVDRIENKAEFYALVARSDGYYACPLCPPEAMTNGRFFLKFEETYKVGVSINPKERYSQAELIRWNLDYFVLAVGSHSEMLVLETIFIGNYPLHPENMKRPLLRRLAVPPGSGTKLR
ncbi:hypothetical protein [Flavilitoribacter nigricans]|uniref:Uncharacterized protein n=1 Tax=Flavilitoribacter nigricans (strain ATCC 23147 / DSM 23189 / NBRC 102662 / NCIMB 1420 / SS-2) TaxID=1122177 RepID=A0A2D0MX91_FLAN2|nr:hypothetical protein [Flavilitoribacter nigricans]PHN00800.1 hypothetical protein CRP01_40375 [Flavilitoribacter nigricans DSM 23189 = NBRC 102662]